MEKYKDKLNEILNSKWFIVVIGIVLLLKSIFFYKQTIASVEGLEIITISGTISFIFVLVCLLSVLPNRSRISAMIIIDILISLILFSDDIYYKFSNNVLSVAQITNLQYTEQITDTLPILLEIKHILYFLDIIMIAILFITRMLKVEKGEKATKQQKIQNAIIVLIGIVIFFKIDMDYIGRGTEKSYNKDTQIAEATIFGYHISDIKNSINYKNQAKYKTYDEMIQVYDELKNEYELKYSQINYDFEGCLENKNILIVQLESVQEFAVNKSINGMEITPNLNKFINENIEFSNMHMQSYSSTADSEYTTVTSTYPMENGMSYSRYYTNTYNNIFELFNKKNYYTSYMHGNDATFWNRGNVYIRMDLNEMVFIDSFDDVSEKISGYLSDELFYKQAVQKLKNQEEPFMTYMVAASSHTPFTLEGIEDKDSKVHLDVGKYKDTYFGNYLEAVNYADYAFGILIDELKQVGLYDDTAILVFGDHNGIGMYDDEIVEFLQDENPNLTDVDIKLNYTRVLCGMKIPGFNESIKIDKVINKLDIKPTFAYLCNLDDEFSLGTNIFGNKDFVYLNNERIIAEDYYFDEDWYYIDTGEKIDLESLSNEEKEKLDYYYDCMKRELDISLSVNINDLLK